MHREVSVRVFGLTATAPGYVAPRGRSTQKNGVPRATNSRHSFHPLSAGSVAE